MIFAIILGLAVLAAADEPVKVQQEHQIAEEQKQPIVPVQPTQENKDINVIPFYKQIFNPYSVAVNNPRDWNLYEGYGSLKYGVPIPPYYSKNVYPYRNNFFLRYLNKVQPSTVDYDSQDVYHYQDAYENQGYVNQPLNSYHPQISRGASDVEYSYDPWWPYSHDYYGRYNAYDESVPSLRIINQYYNRKYPNINKYYGKSLDLDIVSKAKTNLNGLLLNQGYPTFNENLEKSLELDVLTKQNNIYGKTWDTDYIRGYFGRGLKNIGFEHSVNSNIDWESPISYGKLNLGQYKPIVTRRLVPGPAKPIIPIRDVDIEVVKTPISNTLGFSSTVPTVSRNLDSQVLVHPYDELLWNKGYVSKNYVGGLYGNNWNNNLGREML